MSEHITGNFAIKLTVKGALRVGSFVVGCQTQVAHCMDG